MQAPQLHPKSLNQCWGLAHVGLGIAGLRGARAAAFEIVGFSVHLTLVLGVPTAPLSPSLKRTAQEQKDLYFQWTSFPDQA